MSESGGGGYDFERSWSGALNRDGFFREVSGALALGLAKIVTTSAPVTSATTPAFTAGTPDFIRWAANAATTVTSSWHFVLPDDYAEVKTSVAGAATNQDEIRIMLLMLDGGSGSNAAQFTPTISYARGGVAGSNSLALTGYRKGITRERCVGIGAANAFTSGTSFTLTTGLTYPEWIELQFRGNGLKAMDACEFMLTPQNSSNNQADLFGAILRPRRWAAAVLDPQMRY